MPDSTDAGPLGMAALAECPHCGTRVLPLPGGYCPACRRDLDVPPDRSVIVESDEVLVAGRRLARRLLRSRLTVDEVSQNLIDRGIHPGSVARVIREGCAEQIEWLQIRAFKAIRLGLQISLGATCLGFLAFTGPGGPDPNLVLPTSVAVALGLGLLIHGLRLRRRGAAFAAPMVPTMKSRPGLVDINEDSLD